ncbi:MAG: hypothetical protein Kow0047_09140 [Anaerolineae bacterium]
MSQRSIEAIVGTALVDRLFAEELLTQPARVIESFDLDDTEYQAIAPIRARSLEQFAHEIDQRVRRGEPDDIRVALRLPCWGMACRPIML